jgi:hypothetical protein
VVQTKVLVLAAAEHRQWSALVPFGPSGSLIEHCFSQSFKALIKGKQYTTVTDSGPESKDKTSAEFRFQMERTERINPCHCSASA